jgi:hypothetical protein
MRCNLLGIAIQKGSEAGGVLSTYAESRRFVLDGQLFSLPQQIPIPIPFPGRDAIKNRINTGDCNAYIASLIAKAAELSKGKKPALAKDGLDLLSKVKDFVLVNHLKDITGTPIGGTVRGSIAGGDATVLLNTSWMFGSNPKTISMFDNKYLDDALHEMGHIAGYVDRELAVAASMLPGASPGMPSAGAPPRYENGKWIYDMHAIFANGDYYSNS